MTTRQGETFSMHPISHSNRLKRCGNKQHYIIIYFLFVVIRATVVVVAYLQEVVPPCQLFLFDYPARVNEHPSDGAKTAKTLSSRSMEEAEMLNIAAQAHG